MDKIKELKEIIRIQTPLADLGNIESMQMVINAQIELDKVLKAGDREGLTGRRERKTEYS